MGEARLIAIWRYRGFILASVKREFQSKYRNSVLGAAWSVLNPLAMILVYTVIFSQIMRAKLPGVESTFAYSIYLCAGTFAWGLFAEIIGRGQTVFLENANLIKKVSFPKICLPIVVIISSVLNFAIIFGLFTGFLLVTGNFPGWPYLAVFPVLMVLIVLAIGLGIILGVLNVFFRDVAQAVSIILQFWFWLTPIVYPANILPEGLRSLIAINPVVPIVTAYQTILVHSQWPEWKALSTVALFGLALCTLGLWLFRRQSSDMVDEL